ncbi:malonyl-ACP O-methyltransferase BioC [Aestuariirhabdus litorea]|uniref:Malonyl-[acyl-carrier protein] O-methyltransferase n=1 Tax=Aestuariirhabdus litorea TaxID=2528527 RepID=A0A3P3VMP8_9GAMM|nr:malonyl-ACP O-methyltransferase BioC [Aestuariirhabdus litorea]RRJ83168.1 malonyl-[acyl-carrier protein] O-methyltransferase BioC [Aestuariirhabdus litorea]RWW93325.1 malonyl-[acyl-carrier protein] O-methyltransferase BioC [Endozoicomonadaceae bacterium GTF-13]
MVPLNKQAIAESFGRAAASYDSASHLQQAVAAEVMTLIPGRCQPDRVLDLGCGTGVHTDELQRRYPDAWVLGCDLAQGMLAHARAGYPGPSWCGGDAERLPLKADALDLVFSSLAIQWCERFLTVLDEVYRALRPGGVFVFSTLCEGTLQELRMAWQAVDRFSHVNDYPPLHRLQSDAEASRFRVERLQQVPHCVHYGRVVQLNRELIALGANTLTGERRKGLMTPSRLKALQAGYEPFRDEQHRLPATYQVVFGVLIKEA